MTTFSPVSTIRRYLHAPVMRRKELGAGAHAIIQPNCVPDDRCHNFKSIKTSMDTSTGDAGCAKLRKRIA